jgi:hypothetical protein
MLVLLLVETVETPNDGGGGDGGENQQVNGEAQDKSVLQDAEMEEGNADSTSKDVPSYWQYHYINPK